MEPDVFNSAVMTALLSFVENFGRELSSNLSSFRKEMCQEIRHEMLLTRQEIKYELSSMKQEIVGQMVLMEDRLSKGFDDIKHEIIGLQETEVAEPECIDKETREKLVDIVSLAGEVNVGLDINPVEGVDVVGPWVRNDVLSGNSWGKMPVKRNMLTGMLDVLREYFDPSVLGSFIDSQFSRSVPRDVYHEGVWETEGNGTFGRKVKFKFSLNLRVAAYDYGDVFFARLGRKVKIKE